jgi:GNAT superfamily N-acetyltransferase
MAQIRRMLECEAGEVLALWNENCIEAAGRSLSGNESADILALLQRYAVHPDVFCLVAEDQGRLVGFLTACAQSHPVIEGKTGEIEELYVQPEARLKGIGCELVKEAAGLLRGQGALPIRIHACVESPVARGFWQHLGWEQDLVTFSLYEQQE